MGDESGDPGSRRAASIPTDGAARDRSFGLLLLCFFLSGFAGLVYETAWTRQFAFVFGTSSLAVATVLAAYMGGLAAGAAIATWLADRVRKPVLVYGLLELGIGLSALAIPHAIGIARWLYVALYGGQEALPGDGGLTTALFYLACSFVILLVPTAMMGATLPLLTRHAVRNDAEVSSRTGLLYAINTAGAVAGVLLAAFLLLPELGLGRTIQVAALINGLVFLAAWALSRSVEKTPSRVEPAPLERGAVGPARQWILPLIFGSGAASFTYEVVWVRLLGHVLGGSVYAFAAMLASFLLGIAFGSALASRFAKTRAQASLGFAVSQVAIALTSLGAYAISNVLPEIAAFLSRPDAAVSPGGVLAAMLALFPAASFVGATFPLAVRVHARNEADAGAAAARVYAANTLGSIVGAVGAGFFVVPWLGYSGTFAACAALNLVLATVAALGLAPRRPVFALAAGIAAIVAASWPLPAPWAVLMNQPFRLASQSEKKIEYFAVGRSATVLLLAEADGWGLRTNGLPESSMDRPGIMHNRTTLARWLGFGGVLARPNARSMLVVGLGGGVALEFIPPSVERIDVVELENEVVEANRSIGDRRWRDPLVDPRIRLQVNDARNAMLLSDRRFDLIVSQPSHPWAGGAAHLYTREFFELVESRLGEDGVFTQWIGLTFVDEPLFRSLLATLRSVFEHVEVYRPNNTAGVLFLSSHEPIDLVENAQRTIERFPDHFARFGIRRPLDARLARILDDEDTQLLAKGAELIHDDRNQLQSESPTLGVRRLNARNSRFLLEWEAHADRDWPRASAFCAVRRSAVARARRIASQLEDPLDVDVAAAVLMIRGGRNAAAIARLEEVLTVTPSHREARALRLMLARREIRKGASPEALLDTPLSSTEATLASAWIAEGNRDLAALEALELDLLEVELSSLLHPEAARLRATWRTVTGDRALALEAMEIALVESWSSPESGFWLIRARAAVAAEEWLSALDALQNLSRAITRTSPQARSRAESGLATLGRVPSEPDWAEWKATIERQFRARVRSPSRSR